MLKDCLTEFKGISKVEEWWASAASSKHDFRQPLKTPVRVTWQGSEGSLSRLPQRFSLLPPTLRQQPLLLAADLLLSQEEQRVGQAALQRLQLLIYISWRRETDRQPASLCDFRDNSAPDFSEMSQRIKCKLRSAGVKRLSECQKMY